jgi:pseudouridine 5'-phosphatase
MSPRACVIFDLDGTLLDTEPLYTEAAIRVCARYGKTYGAALKRRIMGGDSLRGAETVVIELGLPIAPARYLEEREAELHELVPSAQPMAGALELVTSLAERGAQLAIATSGHRDVTAYKLSFQPFLSVIQLVVCGDDTRLQRGKPEPDIYLLAAQIAGAGPERCVVIEDSVNGVRAGLAAKMRTIALVDPRWGFAPSLFAGAETVRSLTELDADTLMAPRHP